MSVGSFSASLSGMNANQQKLSVIGNNLANINTVGFKASTVNFADLVSQSVGGPSANPMQIGLGVATGSITPNFSQGGIESTGHLDQRRDPGHRLLRRRRRGAARYTRAGNFSFDANGALVTPDGQFVQGYTARRSRSPARSTPTGQPANIVIPPGVLRAPIATSRFGTVANLDAGAAVGSDFTSSVQIYDALGEPHVATTELHQDRPGRVGLRR